MNVKITPAPANDGVITKVTYTSPIGTESTAQIQEKDYWCNACNKKVTSVGIPVGWYMLKKAVPNGTQVYANLRMVSILCGIRCLIVDAVDVVSRRAEDVGRY